MGNAGLKLITYIAAILTGPLPALGEAVPFTEHVISTTVSAGSPLAVFAIDLDGDGDIDVLSASQDDNKIAWYESDGGSPPTFTERVISNSAINASTVFAIDLDGDGDIDVLSAVYNPDKIVWYESDGGSPPKFTEREISTTVYETTSVLAADVDSDGNIDVLSASFTSHRIAWYESDGGTPPNFVERVIPTSAVTPYSVSARDLDGDGDTDILSAAFADGKIAWHENNGDSPPTFTERIISTSAKNTFSVLATDVDGDGDNDVVYASSSNGIAWFESDGGSPPSFVEHVISTAGAVSVFAIDVDGDGDTDVLSASPLDDKIAWFESDGGSPPSFVEHVISTAGAVSVFAIDLDGDGDIDVLSASQDDNKFAWYENLSPCGFDSDCDGDVDLPDLPAFLDQMTGPSSRSRVVLFEHQVDQFVEHGSIRPASLVADLNAPAVSGASLTEALTDQSDEVPFIERVISTNAYEAYSVFATDVDGDGDIDVLSASWLDDKIAWYENEPSTPGFPPTFTEHAISGAAGGPISVFATDLDGDGDIDVLFASANDDRIAWYENEPSASGLPPTFTEHLISGAADWPVFVFAIDLDRDGDIDVLSASRNDHKIAWYENDPGAPGLPPTFTERVISTDARWARSVFAADLDRDGDIDVLSASRADDKIAWYENDGGSPPSFTERVISDNADYAQSVFATDVDGDGDIDVLSASWLDDKIAWYENDGGSPPSFVERVISDNADFALSVFATDLDGDGDTDVLSASLFDDKIAWYENDPGAPGSPPIFTEHVISIAADGAYSVFAVDVDGDGDIDVLSASVNDDKIAWYENLSPCGFDSDCDDDVDLKDFARLQRAFSGPK